MIHKMITRVSIALMSLILAGCSSEEKKSISSKELKILKITVGAEPEDIDPHVVTGVPEHHIIAALTEGLVAEDPVDLHPVPGVAEKWKSLKMEKSTHFKFVKMQSGLMVIR